MKISAPVRNPDLTSKEWVQYFDRLKLGESVFLPKATSLSEAGGGSLSMTGKYYRIGSLIWFTILLSPTGGHTYASTANTTYFDAPLPVSEDNICGAATITNNASFGLGTIRKATNRIYTPGWASSPSNIVVSGWYVTN